VATVERLLAKNWTDPVG